MRLGFSTGFMHKKINPCSKRALEICKAVSIGAIEINCIGGLEEGGDSVFNIDPMPLYGFQYVSLHAPSKVRFGLDLETRTLLSKIEEACRALPIEHAVFHPDLIDNWEVLREFDIPYAFENMDHRKHFGTEVEDMKKIFSIMQSAGFVLDLNHCYSIDSSMELAKIMVSEFGDRLCEVHLSGFVEYHEMLCETRQTQIIDALPGFRAPIILESPCNSIHDAKREYDYVFQNLFVHL